jgi:hypothetical protein
MSSLEDKTFSAKGQPSYHGCKKTTSMNQFIFISFWKKVLVPNVGLCDRLNSNLIF